MKTCRLFMCLWLMVTALSCTEKIGDLSSAPGEGSGIVELTVRAVTSQTKAGMPSEDEDEVSSVQVFLFEDDVLESVAYSPDSNAVSLRCVSGVKSAYVVANYSEIKWYSGMTVSDLMKTVVRLSEERWNVMVGNCTLTVSKLRSVGSSMEGVISVSGDGTASDDSSEVFPEKVNSAEINVKRIAARVVFQKVTNNTVYAEKNYVTPLCAYLTNVMGDAELSATSSNYSHEPDVWYNRGGNEGHLESILYGDINGTFLRGGGETAFVMQYFYCFPNPTREEDSGVGDADTSLPRCTRLVVEAMYNDELSYYPVTIEGIRSNYSYEVTLIITGYGASSPEGQAQKEGASSSRSSSSPHTVSYEGSDENEIVIPITGGCVQVRECCL